MNGKALSSLFILLLVLIPTLVFDSVRIEGLEARAGTAPSRKPSVY